MRFGLHAYDPRDLISVIEMIFGKTDKDFAKGIYICTRRFPIATNYYAYEDASPVLDVLQATNIVDNNGDIIVTAEEINAGRIGLAPFASITAAEVVRDILYAIMYDESTERSLYYEDPLNLSDIPLIPIYTSGISLVDTVVDILSNAYGNNESKIEVFLSFFSNEMNKNEYNLFKFNQVFEVDADREIFVLSPRGTPKEYRYELGLINNRIMIR